MSNNNIFSLINENNANSVKKLLNSGNLSFLNKQNNNGNTALMKAIESNNKEIAELLISKGCDLNLKNEYGNTALIIAIRYAEMEIAQLLIDKGCDLDLQNNEGNTALMISAEYGNKEIAELLISNGCDLDLKNDYGYTALIFAIDNGKMKIAQLLIDKGCDLNLQTEYNYTALNILNEKGYTLKNGIISKKIKNNIENKNINLSKYENKKNILSNILQKYKPIDILFAAIKYKKYIVANEIIKDKSIDLNIRNIYGNTPLMYAIKVSQNKKIINLNISKRFFKYITEYDIIKLLIDSGCNLDIQNNEGNTALMIAIKDNKKTDIVKLLIDSGCDLNLENKDKVVYKNKDQDIEFEFEGGNTALSLAIQNKRFNTINMLLDKECNFNNKEITFLIKLYNDGNTSAVGPLEKMGRILEKRLEAKNITKNKKHELEGYYSVVKNII
jgi:ankyrin repeat protein